MTFTVPLVVQDPVNGWAYVSLTSLMMTSGMMGNVLIIATILTSSYNRHLGNELVVNIALADLFIAGVAQPMCLIGKY